jgi:predicted phosphodiesterase
MKTGTPAPLGRFLFRFAVIADTHVNQEEGKTSSPFAILATSNARTRFVVADINRRQPSFVLHLGDIVHPVPELPSYVPAAKAFKELASQLSMPLHLVAGNHDVGDKRVDWMPAGTIEDRHLTLYREHFGRDYYSFDSDGCHFVVINAQVINSGLQADAEQAAWLEKDAEANRNARTFWAIHYPPFVSEPAEASSYDNLDEPGRSWLLGLVERYKPEAVFAGHVHNLWYNLYRNTECYVLPSTAFVRHDYADMYRDSPGPLQGRNDVAKLGYVMVDVHEHGHVPYLIRTDGQTLAPEATVQADSVSLPLVHTRTTAQPVLGLDLRNPWAETVEIAATGGVQEFGRKRARNDYPVYAIWEMGVRDLRIPLQDLLDADVRARMRLMVGLGHRFTVYMFETPVGTALESLLQHSELVSGIEVVLSWNRLPDALPKLAAIREKARFSIWLSKLRKHEDAKYDGSRFSHFINHGFVPSEHEQLADAAGLAGKTVDGFVFRVARDRSPLESCREIAGLCKRLGVGAIAHVRLAAENPAEIPDNPLEAANRVAEAAFATMWTPTVPVFLDTFAEIDRGYFPRAGLVDRRYNPLPAGKVLKHFHAATGNAIRTGEAACSLIAGGRRLSVDAQGRCWELLLPDAPGHQFFVRADAHDMEVIDLIDGCIVQRVVRGAGSEVACAGPILLRPRGTPAKPHAAATVWEGA